METLESIINAAKAAIRKTDTKVRYRLPFTEESVAPLLADSYAALVASRGGELQDDDATRRNIARVARWLTSDSTKPMLMLYGGVGNGKTTMARAVVLLSSSLRSAYEEVSRNERDTKTSDALYIKASAIRVPAIYTAQDIANLAGSRRAEYEAIVARSFLIIDDLGCEPAVVKNYGTELTPITDLIYKRYDAMSPTVVTTNLTKAAIREIYGDRVADRFNEVFETIGYQEKSYRR